VILLLTLRSVEKLFLPLILVQILSHGIQGGPQALEMPIEVVASTSSCSAAKALRWSASRRISAGTTYSTKRLCKLLDGRILPTIF
jgi:hypothetical protein